MATIIHEIDGDPSDGPKNWPELKIKVERKDNAISLEIDSITLTGKDAIKVRNKFLSGTTGGTGMFEGIPYKIKIIEGGNLLNVFDGFLNASTGSTFVGCDEFICSLQKRKGNEWLNDVADGFSFASLYDEGVITNNDFQNVGYIRNYVPDGFVLMTLSISAFIMTKEAIELAREIANQIAELINAATPNVGVGITVDVGDIIWSVLKILARIVYGIFIVIAIIKLMADIFEQLLPLKRFHKAMKFVTLFEKACEKLDMTFQSSLFQSGGRYQDWTYIPTKDKKGFLSITQNYSGVTGLGGAGYPAIDDPIETFGDLIRVMKESMNADYKIENGVFIFERRDYWEGLNNYIVPGVYNDQEGRRDNWIPNADEIVSNYNIVWRYDNQDQNTLDDQTGRVFQATLSRETFTNKDLITLPGLRQVKIPFARGSRKNELTAYEKIAKGIGTFVDVLTGVFGGGTNLASQVQGRIGNLLLSSDQISVPKVVQMSGNKLAPNQGSLVSAEVLWDNEHFINSFAPIDGFHNQYKKFPNKEVGMSLEDFLSLVENLNCKTEDDKDALIDQMVYLPYYKECVLDLRIKELYDTNFKITKIT